MTRTRVLKHGMLALGAALFFTPAAHAATNAAVSGSSTAATLTASVGAASTVTVTLPGDALAPPCDVAPCTSPTGPEPAQYRVHDPLGVSPGANCVQGTLPDDGDPATPLAPDPNTALCSRMGAVWGAYTVKLLGSTGNDTLRIIAPLVVSGEGNTGDTYWLQGNAGNDTLVGSENNDFMAGGPGNDLIEGDAGNDLVTGGNLPDAVDPVSGLPTAINYFVGTFPVSTDAGTDRVFGGAGSDTISDGDSDVAAAATADTLSGFSCTGSGAAGGGACPATSSVNIDVPENDIDELFWGHRTRAVRVNLSQASAQGGCPTTAACTTGGENEIILGMRGVYSGAGNDTLTGHAPGAAAVGNTFYSGAGNDTLNGLDGNDELVAGPGADTINGGDGADIMSPGGLVTSAAGQPTVMVADGADIVDGGASGTDTTGDGSTAVSVNDSITYAGRSDNLTLDLNSTTGWGAAGENDQVTNVEDVTGGHGADTITLKAGQASIVEADPIAPEAAHPGEPVLPSPPPGGYYSDDVVNARNGATDTIYCGGVAPDLDNDRVAADRTPADVTQPDCEVVDLPPIPQPACSDGVDNDGDGKIDLQDIGCTSAQDNDESNAAAGAPPACADGRDNDGDGKIDFPTDPGCAAAGDVDETDPATGPGPGVTATNRVRITGPSSAGTVKVKRDGSFTLSRIRITCPSGSRSCSVRTTVAVTARKAANYTLRAGRTAAARGKLGKKQLSQLKKRKRLKATVTIRVVRNGVTTTKKVKVTFRR